MISTTIQRFARRLPAIEVDGESALAIAALVTVGYLTLSGDRSPAPAQAANPQGTLAAIAQQIQVRDGRSVFDLGCPRSYATRGGTGSVCCANQVSAALKAAGVPIQGSDAVMPLVQQLRAIGWRQVPIDQAPPGAVVFSNRWGGLETRNPGQHIELAASPGAKTTAGSWGQKFQTHGDYAASEHRAWKLKGGNFGGALVPPN